MAYYGQPQPYYPPHGVPQYQTQKRDSGTKCCLRCICCCYCLLLLWILANVGIAIFVFVDLKPEMPKYDLKDVLVKTFDIKDKNLTTDIDVALEADNPNTKIKLYYEKGSSIDVSHSGMKICSGSGPEFEQPTMNTTLINIGLQGNNEMSPGFQVSFLKSSMEGKILLDIEIKAPIRGVFSGHKSRKLECTLKCSVIVDNLMPGEKVNILDKICDLKIKI